MRKKYLAITVIISLFPQTVLAHFTENHAPIWQEPMHYLLQHYQGVFIIAIVAVIFVIYLKKLSDKE